MRRRIAGFCGSLALLLVGCSLVTSLDGLSDPEATTPGPGEEGGPPGSDGAVEPHTDGATTDDRAAPPDDGGELSDADAGDAKNDAPGGPVNLVSNPSFELSGALCGPGWNPTGATTATLDGPPHSGAKSCKVCNTGAPNSNIGVVFSVAEGAWGPGKYTLTVYAKAETGNTILAIEQLTVKKAASTDYPGFNGAATALSWHELKFTINVLAGESVLGLLVGGNAETTGECVFVDDVSLVRE